VGSRTGPRGALLWVKPDGTEEALETPSLAPRSAAEIEAAAARNPENLPLRNAGRANAFRVPR